MTVGPQTRNVPAGFAGRLRRLRTQRRSTSIEPPKTMGGPKSSLSRLETGQREPSRELLLLTAPAYRDALDELGGAAEVGDARILPRHDERSVRVVVPLTRHPSEMHVHDLR